MVNYNIYIYTRNKNIIQDDSSHIHVYIIHIYKIIVKTKMTNTPTANTLINTPLYHKHIIKNIDALEIRRDRFVDNRR